MTLLKHEKIIRMELLLRTEEFTYDCQIITKIFNQGRRNQLINGNLLKSRDL